MDNTERLLEIKGLTIEFAIGKDKSTVVHNANIDIYPKETVVLAGESGSGKTITALSVTRILPKNALITSGTVIFNQRDLLGINESDLISVRGRQIAYIFQEPAAYLNPVFTIGNQISEAIILHQGKSKKGAFLETLNLLGLVKITDPERVFFNYPHQLSGGMNQRALIAMALACKPKLLIADEPTTSLDATTESQIIGLLTELKSKLGFSLLFITHNLAIARRIADRIFVMYRGEIVDHGYTREIFDSPKHFHSRELIRAYEKIGRL